MKHAREFLLLPQSSLKISSFFSLGLRFQRSGILTHCPKSRVGFGPKFCGADGKPTFSETLRFAQSYVQSVESDAFLHRL